MFVQQDFIKAFGSTVDISIGRDSATFNLSARLKPAVAKPPHPVRAPGPAATPWSQAMPESTAPSTTSPEPVTSSVLSQDAIIEDTMIRSSQPVVIDLTSDDEEDMP